MARLRRIRMFSARREDLTLLDDGSFVGELSLICFAITGAGQVEASPGWLFCNGFAVSRVTFKRLFDEIGTSYGVGDGSTTFNLPDFRGRSPLAWADAQTGATRVANAGALGNATAVGGVGGADTVALGKAHLPAHVHTAGSFSISGGAHAHGPGTIGVHQSSGDGSAASARNAHDGGSGPVTSVNLPVAGNLDAASHTHASGDFSGNSEDGSAAGLAAGTPSHNNVHPHLPATGMVIRT